MFFTYYWYSSPMLYLETTKLYLFRLMINIRVSELCVEWTYLIGISKHFSFFIAMCLAFYFYIHFSFKRIQHFSFNFIFQFQSNYKMLAISLFYVQKEEQYLSSTFGITKPTYCMNSNWNLGTIGRRICCANLRFLLFSNFGTRLVYSSIRFFLCNLFQPTQNILKLIGLQRA
ncbi:Hypothetical_protein [Hexamita inflata]|uniref:Hypothetical_protein n=1 Tax=Hexamita inflata TaxID=28002 RepID=A0AA86NUB6_9EUKA|nr:Hypothetical protein HINF_LOCUS13042 [Hexamita inflata]